MNAKTTKLLRKYAEVAKLNYKTCKHVLVSGGKQEQQRYLQEIKSALTSIKQ